MGVLLFVVGTYLLINITLIGVGIGVGFLLHWLLPAVEPGMAILIGVIATGLSIHFYARLTAHLEAYGDEGMEREPGPVLTIAPMRSIGSRRRRKRKSS